MTDHSQAAARTAGPLLELSEVSVAIDSTPVLRAVSLALRKGEMVSLVGRNGAGKTTTMRAIMGLLPVRAGRISLGDRVLSDEPAHRRVDLGIGYMPEDRRLIPRYTVEENILMSSWMGANRHNRTRLGEVYAFIPELEGFAQRQALSLSGGQQKLVALGRALLAGRDVLLLDEPFEGVAPALVQRISEIMSQLSSRSDRTVLVSDSSLSEGNTFYDRHVFIERGQISGDPV
ncbi:ATP-binding cassette domain-containing protein [Roseovarius ramblicola]|uniref:ATP-binding cassette domain-containing protein n=1 Tax=Roseovarius ramblicola TaxID=2022336 RepID=A0ABV5I4P7_9RHOB